MFVSVCRVFIAERQDAGEDRLEFYCVQIFTVYTDAIEVHIVARDRFRVANQAVEQSRAQIYGPAYVTPISFYGEKFSKKFFISNLSSSPRTFLRRGECCERCINTYLALEERLFDVVLKIKNRMYEWRFMSFVFNTKHSYFSVFVVGNKCLQTLCRARHDLLILKQMQHLFQDFLANLIS